MLVSFYQKVARVKGGFSDNSWIDEYVTDIYSGRDNHLQLLTF